MGEFFRISEQTMCSVGVDIGTTTIKVCVVQGTKILTESQVRHNANVDGRLGVQDARKIITEAEALLRVRTALKPL
ncbi:hypothetical protein Y032_0003g1493 [Ancylostoma ceylanicum]|uniref:Carbohydrate kinase FGGY N-terminal domain-containing protein n=1 Tax=Ancylostoma ceylanicum TaxID=53326 RepID=A0A016VZS1_9BILA|nr:hypothetical protein Y032_0003g1493 [Ancylostoma ceylanicum]